MAHLHLGLILPNYGEALGAERLASAATAAEEAGFDSGWVTDHLIVPPEHAPVYGTSAEALVSLGFLAARTRRLELGVSALVVPQRNPLVALKQLATLDLLSDGRIVTAVAAGWMEGEFTLLGADFERRGPLLDEWLDLASSVFEQMPGRVVYEGDFFSVDGWLSPAPVRPGGPELWVAGCRGRLYDGRRAQASGIPWHFRPTSSACGPPSCTGDGQTAALCCASAYRSGLSPRRGATSAVATRSPVRRSGWSSGSWSISTLVATASSSTSSTTAPVSTSVCSSSESGLLFQCEKLVHDMHERTTLTKTDEKGAPPPRRH